MTEFEKTYQNYNPRQAALDEARALLTAAAKAAMADGALTATDNIGLIGLCALVALLTLAAVFLYNNRPLQGRISAMAGIAALMGAALVGIQMYQTMNAVPEGGTLQVGAGIALPVMAILFAGLAGRYIRKDEKLVRSADRLR